MKIRVTQKDIDKAKEIRGSGENEPLTTICPVAQACRRQLFEWVDNVYVEKRMVRFRVNNKYGWCCSLPYKVKIFIEEFDLHHFVEPFEFELDTTEIEKPVKITLDEPTEPLECELVKV